MLVMPHHQPTTVAMHIILLNAVDATLHILLAIINFSFGIEELLVIQDLVPLELVVPAVRSHLNRNGNCS